MSKRKPDAELWEAVRREVAEWDSQVADPNAACYACEDPSPIAEYRRILAALEKA